jgi:hypothetical protein
MISAKKCVAVVLLILHGLMLRTSSKAVIATTMLKGLVWVVSIVAILLTALRTLSEFMKPVPDYVGFSMTRQGIENFATYCFAPIYMLTLLACLLALSARHFQMRWRNPGNDTFWALLVGSIAIMLIATIFFAVAFFGASLLGATIETGGWLILLFPVFILAFAIWGVVAVLAVYVITKCFNVVAAAWQGKVDLGQLGTIVNKLLSNLPMASQPATENPVEPSAQTVSAAPQPTPTFGKR